MRTAFLFAVILGISWQLYAEVPCWFNSPVTQDYMGFIGAASAFSAKTNGAELSSRTKALTQLLTYYNIEPKPEFNVTNYPI